MRLRNYLAASLLAASLGLGASALLAQGIITGTLSGTVQDPTGAIIPGAVVTAIDPAKGTPFTTTASSKGEFSFSQLPVGIYNVTIHYAGFADLRLQKVGVETGKDTGLGIEKLTTGSAVETVEVSTAQNLLETVQSQVTTTFDSEQIQNLPTGGGFDELALLIPGVVSTHGNNRSNTNGAGISSNGQRGRSNNFEIDGQSNNDNSVTGPQIFFSNSDALSEVQIITNNFSAQYGRDAGSIVNYITKSGTNQIHGTAFEYYSGSFLNSLSQGQKSAFAGGICNSTQNPTNDGCIPLHRPRYDNNNYGGTIGFPIIRDKLFGFGSAAFQNNLNGTQYAVSTSSVGGATGYTPTKNGLAQLAAAYATNRGVQSLLAYGPYAIPLGIVVPITSTIKTITVSDGVTSTPIEVSQYQRRYTNHNTDEEVLGRMDYRLSAKNSFYLRYFYQKAPSFLASGTASTGGLVDVTDKDHSIGADWTHVFGPRVVNQLRYSFQQSTVNFDGGAFPSCTVNSFASCPSSFGVSTASSGRVGGISLGAFGLSSSYPQGRVVKDTQIQDNLSLSFGRHSISIGGSWEFQNSPNTFLPNINGAYTFTGFNALLGNPANSQTLGLAIGNPKIDFREPDTAGYIQDDWKVSPSLTLNIGVRGEYFGQSINLLNKISVAQQTGPSPLWNTALPLSVTTFPTVPESYRNIEPRLGFAYNPAAFKSMVLRGGYSINVAPAYYNIFLNSYGSAPVVLAATISGCNNTTKICLPTGGANNTSIQGLKSLLPTGGNPGNYAQTFVGGNFRQPMTQTYSLGVQQEVGRFAVVEVRYVGVHTSGDFQSINGNPNIAAAAAAFPTFFAGYTPCAVTTLPSAAPATDVGRIHCGQSNVRIRANTAFEVYNGLQTSLNTRNYHGLTANASYTFSRTVDNASEIFSTNGAGTSNAFSANPLDPNLGERGVSGNSYPNVTSLGLTYKDPHFQQNHSFVGKVLGGFQFNTIYLFNSGQPFTPIQLLEGSYCDTSFSQTFNGSVDTCRPILSNPNAPYQNLGIYSGGILYDYNTGNPVASSAEHFIINTKAAANLAGNPYAGVGRNTLRGNSFNNVDASIFKNNKISERINLQLQAQFFNVLNRAYYGAPDALVEDVANTPPGGSTGTFGNFSGNGGSIRSTTFGARILF